MMSDRNIVYLIDGDLELRQTLARQLQTTGRDVWTFPSPSELMASLPVLPPGCILLALRAATRASLRAVDEISEHIAQWPLIVIAKCDALALAVEAVNRGAWDFLQAPVDDAWLDATMVMAESVLMQRLPGSRGRPGIAVGT